VSPRGLRPGQVNFRSHNSCLPLGASFPGRRRACVLFGVSFRGGYSPTGLPGDTAWLASPPLGGVGWACCHNAAGRDERAEQRLGLVRARRTAAVTAGLGLARAAGARDHEKRGLHACECRGSKGCDLG